jgi:ADP-ribosylglycohydrolase
LAFKNGYTGVTKHY